MADFKEIMHISQIDTYEYQWYWKQIDTATDKVKDYDYSRSCSAEELYDSIEVHGFDAYRVFNHFEDYPLSSMVLKKEY